MKPMPTVECPTLQELFGPGVDRCDVMQLTVHRVDTLAEIDRIILCKDLPKTVRQSAERQKGILERVQAAAGDDRTLRELMVNDSVALRSGAQKLCRRLIKACS